VYPSVRDAIEMGVSLGTGCNRNGCIPRYGMQSRWVGRAWRNGGVSSSPTRKSRFARYHPLSAEVTPERVQVAAAVFAPLLENLCLSTPANNELCVCMRDWQRLPDGWWHSKGGALQAVAVVDRVRRALGTLSDAMTASLQTTAETVGGALNEVEDWQVRPSAALLYSAPHEAGDGDLFRANRNEEGFGGDELTRPIPLT
jgi:hypothetical protein